MAFNSKSVVDFLTSRGFKSDTSEKLPLFNFRKKLFSDIGLSPEKTDEFRGTESENLALLSSLARAERASGVSINPENVLSVIRTTRPTASTGITPENLLRNTDTENQVLANASPEQFDEAADRAGFETEPATLEGTEFKRTELSPKDLAQRALEEATGGVAFPLRQEAVATEKEELALKGQADKEEFIAKLAARGLTFSGQKQKGLNAIEADTLAKQLGVDRKFALLIATGLDTAAQRIAKEAQAGDKEAISSLRALGFDVDPTTNRIMPTLAARKAEEAEVRAEKRAQETQERFETSQAAIERRYQQTQKRLKDIADNKTTRFTASSLPADVQADILSDIESDASLSDLYEAYTDVSPELIQSLYYNR